MTGFPQIAALLGQHSIVQPTCPTMYGLPNGDIRIFGSILHVLQAHSRNSSFIVLAGDLNLPQIDWKNMTPLTGYYHSNALIDIAFSYNVQKIVNSTAHTSPRCGSPLDLRFVSE